MTETEIALATLEAATFQRPEHSCASASADVHISGVTDLFHLHGSLGESPLPRHRSADRSNRALLLVRRRILSAIPVLAIVVLGAFALLEAAPGDAVDAYVVSTGGGDAELVAKLRQDWGLDQSGPARLGVYLSALARGDLGWSVTFSRPVLDVILERLPNTLLLMASRPPYPSAWVRCWGLSRARDQAAPGIGRSPSGHLRFMRYPVSGSVWCWLSFSEFNCVCCLFPGSKRLHPANPGWNGLRISRDIWYCRFRHSA